MCIDYPIIKIDCNDTFMSNYCVFCSDPLPCEEGLHECHSKLCIADDSLCDLINDCGDWSDEVGCCEYLLIWYNFFLINCMIFKYCCFALLMRILF